MANPNFCPNCGKQGLEDYGFVFIEDGPWNGKEYANEGECPRYRCPHCEYVFAAAPKPLLCTKCGERVVGELDEDCAEDPDLEGGYLCEECMPKAETQLRPAESGKEQHE